MPTEQQLRDDFYAWFKSEYGVPPVVTSSTGLPAVHFALCILKRYGAIKEASEG